MKPIKIRSEKIISRAPGRICLFGDHQDYLELPIIACAINRYITLTAEKNDLNELIIYLPDIGRKQSIQLTTDFNDVEKKDHFVSVLKVLKAYNCTPDVGYTITISGDIPINAGISSSSAVIVCWTHFLVDAFGLSVDATPEFIAKIAYEAEVIEQGSPGGRMDQFSISLGNIIYLETGERLAYEVLTTPLSGLIIGESGIPKETIGLLSKLKEKAWEAIRSVQQAIPDFDLKSAKLVNIERYSGHIQEDLKPYFYAALANHDITQRALTEFRNNVPDLAIIGALMTEHHNILKDFLKITVPIIDLMIDAALSAGALGAKIVGSGGGGSIVVLASPGEEEVIIKAIRDAGGKAAYKVEVDSGARILNPI